jgi:hypothetical protein
MENLDNFNLNLSLNDQAKAYLREAVRWERFLAILAFIAAGFIMLIGIAFGSIMSTISGFSGNPALSSGVPTGLITVLYAIIGLISGIPAYYSYQFAVKTLSAIDNDDSDGLTEGLKNLKSMNKFKGILAIVVLSFYAIIILFAVVMAMAS